MSDQVENQNVGFLMTRLILCLAPYSIQHFASFDSDLELKSILNKLPRVKFTKLQYNLMVFIATLLRVTDEDSLSEIALYDQEYFHRFQRN